MISKFALCKSKNSKVKKVQFCSISEERSLQEEEFKSFILVKVNTQCQYCTTRKLHLKPYFIKSIKVLSAVCSM